VHFTHLFDHCCQLAHFPVPWKEAEIISLLKSSKDPEFPRNLHPFSLLSATGKLFEKLILRTIQKAHWGKKVSSSQFGFPADHSMTLQCVGWRIMSP
jgi:hypothetical protein